MKVHAKSNEDVFEKMSVGEAVRTMAVPAVAAQLIVLIYNLADTFYVGRTNNPFMVAGVSLILPLFNVALRSGRFSAPAAARFCQGFWRLTGKTRRRVSRPIA